MNHSFDLKITELHATTALLLLMALLIGVTLPVSGDDWTFFQQEENTTRTNFLSRWGLRAIRAPAAWKISRGSEEVVVAVIDSGVDSSLPQIEKNMWINEDEIPQDGLDNDDNGYVDDVHGWDFWDEDTCSAKGSSINYHGTFVAGIIAARPDETTGTAGVAPGISLMDLRVLDDRGQLYTTDWSKLVDAINYAVHNGADIINLSIYSTLTPPDFVHHAIKQAVNKGVLVIGIPGNGGEEVRYFGQWEEVLTVGAVDKDGTPWNYSNHGSSVDLVGPGVDVLSLTSNGEMERRSGTSFAAAHVAGAAALVLSVEPELSVDRLREVLRDSARDLFEPGYDSKTGYGLVNVEKALSLVE
ncbi:S8 family serine peptidase [Candidatus Bipolaricaulota bacterium]|nr:S8 family serine peptidase [Candidatus Bipolaricaulota bacterium]